MNPLADALPYSLNLYPFPQGAEILPMIEIDLNRALLGEMSSTIPPRTASPTKLYAIMSKYGYKTGKLPTLS